MSRYKCVVGLSDHTMGNAVAITSIALGATIIEKHFTTDRNIAGVTHRFLQTLQK